MSKALTSSMALSASSADYSVLISTENPTYLLGHIVSAPAVVWAQFTYETMVPIILDIAAAVIYNNGNNITSILSVNLQGAKDNFETSIETRLGQVSYVYVLLPMNENKHMRCPN